MPIQLIPEEHKAHKEVQAAIINISAAIDCLSRALEVDENITEQITECQRGIMAEMIAGFLLDREDLIHLGVNKTVLRLPPGYFMDANHYLKILPELRHRQG